MPNYSVKDGWSPWQQAPNYPTFLALANQYFRSSCRKLGIRLFVTALVLAYMTISFVSYPRNMSRSLPDEAPPRLPSHRNHTQKTGLLRRWYLTNVTLRQSLTFQSVLPTCHVWPEQQPHNDRIEHQLLMRPTKRLRQEKLILLTNVDGRDHTKPPSGEGVFIKNKCPVTACTITYNFTQANRAAAIILKDWINPILVDKNLYKRPADQIWILKILESPHYTADFSIVDGHVNWTATYRQDSELVTPYEKFVLYDPNVLSKKQAVNYGAQKQGKTKIAWFVSNCRTTNDRMHYVKELRKYIDVDIFGKCGPNKCDKRTKRCQDILRRDYKFYLSFENSNCLWYITEKFWIPLMNDVIPIAMGPPRSHYEAVAPHQSFIHVSDFPSPKELADYLHRLNKSDEEYNAYFQWKGTGELIDTRFYCRLCALLHADKAPTNTYQHIGNWWSGPQTCSHEKKLNPVVDMDDA